MLPEIGSEFFKPKLTRFGLESVEPRPVPMLAQPVTITASSGKPSFSIGCFMSHLLADFANDASAARQLIADRQLGNALAGGGEDGVAERRCDRRQARLAHTAQRHRPAGRPQPARPDRAPPPAAPRHPGPIGCADSE